MTTAKAKGPEAGDAARPPRKARGKRPRYFDDPVLDQMHAMILATTAEISVLFDRFDALERMLDGKGVLRREDLERWQPDAKAWQERKDKREALIRRLMRSVHDERRALEGEET